MMVKLLIAIPTRGCIVFLKRLRLSIGFPVDSSTTILVEVCGTML